MNVVLISNPRNCGATRIDQMNTLLVRVMDLKGCCPLKNSIEIRAISPFFYSWMKWLESYPTVQLGRAKGQRDTSNDQSLIHCIHDINLWFDFRFWFLAYLVLLWRWIEDDVSWSRLKLLKLRVELFILLSYIRFLTWLLVILFFTTRCLT